MLVPERVNAFWMPPATRPNSAEKLVTAWNSCTASWLITRLRAPPCRLFDTPSTFICRRPSPP